MRSRFNRALNGSTAVSFTALILLFPGFFVYHYAVGKGFISPFLGGYFGNVSVALVIPLILAQWRNLSRSHDSTTKLFCFTLFLIATISFWNYLNRNPDGWHEEMFEWSIAGVLFNIVCYLIGRGLSINWIAGVVLILFGLMVGLVLVGKGDAGMFYVRRDAGTSVESVATYQGFGRSLAVVALFLSAAYWKDRMLFMPIVVCGFISLFFNGARTEFISFACAVIVLAGIDCLDSRRAFSRMVMISIAGVVVSVYLFGFAPSSRMSQIQEIGESSSALSRMDLLKNGLEIIFEHPILGNYGDYVKIRGTGSYPHNIIASWVNFGILGFFCYVAMFVIMWKNVKQLKKGVSDFYEFRMFILLLSFNTIALMFAKEYSYMLFGLLLGVHARCLDLYRRALFLRSPPRSSAAALAKK